MQPQGNLYKPMQDLVFFQPLACCVLTFNAFGQITPVAIRHDDTELGTTFGKEGIFVTNNVGVVEPLHEFDFVAARRSFRRGNVGQFDAFHAVMFVFLCGQEEG
jgi:hypothetical protein